MSGIRIVIAGSSGFLGRNLEEEFSRCKEFEIYTTSRELPDDPSMKRIHFDITRQETWKSILEIKPDIFINSVGYGVVKYEGDLQKMYEVNYIMPARLSEYLYAETPQLFWIQIGTAFEYDLGLKDITESSPCMPRTHYGISKWMFSHYLLNSRTSRDFLILRPFGMFGPFEDETKIIPYLILSQLKSMPADLSDGRQVRDYIYVKDVARFLLDLIKTEKYKTISSIINIGSGEGRKLLEIAEKLSATIPGFDPALWRWNKLSQRVNESDIFVNSSSLAKGLGLSVTSWDKAFIETVNYYKERRAHV